ncbi:MAG TPA: prephenate dehydrogenase [Planctomycetota bacterium]|nr:prephenate dehydrogenase [Planctomycetota bacterium]
MNTAEPVSGVLPFRSVAIVGVGLIGGSLGLALRQRQLARRVVGVGRRQASLDRAVAMGAIDEGTLDIRAGVAEAELVVLATPVGVMVELARAAADAVPRGALMTDVGSTKAQLVGALEQVTGGRLRYVGSHPMAGSEKRGVDEAAPGLFAGAVCFVTPTPRTDPLALAAVGELWQAVGARVRRLDPAEHDRLLALASHLPHLVAAALVNTLSPEALACAGPGFRDTTRVASGDPRLWADVCLQNRERLLDALARFDHQARTLRRILSDGSEAELLAWLESAKAVRDRHLRS